MTFRRPETNTTSVGTIGPQEPAHRPDETAAFEDLLAEMSGAFVRATADKVDTEIDHWLQRVVLALDIDRASVGEYNAGEGTFYTTHQWGREGVRPLPSPLNANKALPWLVSKLLADELVVIERLDDVPPEAAEDVRFARSGGTKSNVTVPLKIGGQVIGGVSFGTMFAERRWSPAIVQRLKLVADVFGNALERKRNVAQINDLNAEIHRISRVAIMRELTASLAHELNQPLGAILSNAQAARRFLVAKKPNLEEVRSALDEIIRDNSRAVEIIQNVRGLFQAAKSEKRRTDARQLLRDVEVILGSDAARRQISFRVEAPETLPTIIVDRSQIMQALINLIVNAFDAVADVADGFREVVVTATELEPRHLRMTVRDSGKGIDPQIMPRLFQAFVTTKSEGMGLGLAIARSMIQSHGGELKAIPNPDRGTTMEFDLPAETVTSSEG